MKKGLVMEGGAMRGMYTAGVLDVFMEQGIEFDGAIGVSAGACFGCNIKSKQPGRAIRYNKRYCKDKRYGYMKNFFKTGDVYDVELCYELIPKEYDPFDYDTYKNNPMEFYAVATDANTGRAVYKRCDDLSGVDMGWIRASASMPVVSNMVKIDGGEYSDGGTADSVPLSYFQSIGYDKNVVILTQPADYRKEKSGNMLVIKTSLRKYPYLIKALESRPKRYNENIAYIRSEENKGRAFVIAPEMRLPAQGTEHNPEILEQTYRIGRADAMKNLDGVREFLRED